MDHSFPTASVENLKTRAAMLVQIRRFFSERQVLEVETPLLAKHSVTDPHMQALKADNPLGNGDAFYLQTSPEYAMKRLLAAGSGAIYQLCKAFRAGEVSRRHNPEFTMLEWYRPDFSDADLMDEVEALMDTLFENIAPAQRLSYRQLFEQYLGFDPHVTEVKKIEQAAREQLDVQMQSDDRDDWLNLLMAEVIEPQLDFDVPTFVFDYPASQCALAKVERDTENMLVAKRFEMYFRGVELANGYLEETDTKKLQQRFEQDLLRRRQLGRPEVKIDQYLLAAMEKNFPACAGVAMGFDRLVMLRCQAESIEQVISFPSDRA